jgi:hypothetical protein
MTTCDLPYPQVECRVGQDPSAGNRERRLNPARVRPRHIFDRGAGTDNVFRSERVRWTVRLEVLNLTHKVAMFNFLSTCAGTHFVAPDCPVRPWESLSNIRQPFRSGNR